MRFEHEFRPEPGDLVREIRGKAQAAHRRTTKTFALEIWGNVGEEAPKDHGRLAGSFVLKPLGPVVWRIATNVEYAEAVHEGSKPHTIEPRNARALRFEVEGDTVFARRVRHPGTEPNPFIDRSIDAAEERLPDFANRELRRAGLL